MATVNMTMTRDGLELLWNSFYGKEVYADFKLRLFSNDETITQETVLADLTETLNYTSATLLTTNWTVSYTTKGLGTYTVEVEFPFTGAGDVYGGYITNSAGTVLIAAGNKGSLNSYTSGDSYIITEVRTGATSV